jgi:hypothetical protein
VGHRDEGSSMIIALVVMVVGALMVLPVMGYTMSVLRTNKSSSAKLARVEVVEGGLRATLYDPLKLYQACVDSGYSTAVQLAAPPDLNIESECTTVGSSLQDVPSDQHYALTTTQVGSNAVIPAPYVAAPEEVELDGTISPTWCTSMVPVGDAGKVPCGKPYPANGDLDPLRWLGATSHESGGGAIFVPYLPPVANAFAYAGGYDMIEGPCRVFFPGRYVDDVVITGSTPVYFASGIYYFEKTVRISGDANVVVGAGSTPGCVESDAVAVADAINVPFDAYSNGVGGTWVFGQNGRLVIDTATPSTGAGVNLVFNRRLVANTDPEAVMNEVSIMSVNGVLAGTATVDLDIDLDGDLEAKIDLHVPATQVLGDPPVDAVNHLYKASNLVSTFGPPVSCAISASVPGCPIIDINLGTTAPVNVKIPGYVSIPQGMLSLVVADGANVNKRIAFGGGILAAQMAVSAVVPDFLQLGLLNPVVQKTFKIVTRTVSGSPRLVATAQVQVNETGGYAINSWVVKSEYVAT